MIIFDFIIDIRSSSFYANHWQNYRDGLSFPRESHTTRFPSEHEGHTGKTTGESSNPNVVKPGKSLDASTRSVGIQDQDPSVNDFR